MGLWALMSDLYECKFQLYTAVLYGAQGPM